MPDYKALAAQYARQYGIPVGVFLRQINQESGFNPNAHSSAGAEGIAQFMPATARSHGLTNPYDPNAALKAAAQFDADLFGKYGVAGGLSAYNSGRPDAYKDPNFAQGQTYNYVRSIMGGAPVPVTVPTAHPAQAQAVAALSGQRQQPDMSNVRQLAAAYLLQQSQANAAGAPLNGSGGLLALALARQQAQAAQQRYGPSIQPPAQAKAPVNVSAPAGAGAEFMGQTAGENPQFLHNLSVAAASVGGTKIRVNSGERSPAHNAGVGGVAHSNHLPGADGYAHAMDGDVFIPGKGWVPLGVALLGVAPKYGLRSGDQPGFYNGGPDLVHVDDGYNQR